MSNIEVHIELNDKTTSVGTLYSHVRRGRESSTFRYEAAYIAVADAYALEPEMSLSLGEHAFLNGLPRSFRDSSPDRWGRMLIEKGLRQQWAEEGLPARTITEVDYLLGTADISRQGALRFKQPGNTEFEAVTSEVPKLVALSKLLSASHKICKNAQNDRSTLAAVKTLLDAGTGSLGGARPKATVVDVDKDGHESFHIAKFPHAEDKWDVMRWEKIALELAAIAGIKTPENRMINIDNSSVLMLKRFDRSDTGKRIGYASAMTLLESEEGETHDYLDLADILAEISDVATKDLNELWRRIIFSLLINNTDDHLRNHAVLRHVKAWRLSPAFDINPNPDLSSQRATSIQGETHFEKGWQAANDTHEWFGLSQTKAAEISAKVLSAISQWKTVALRYGATKQEMSLFQPVFERALSTARAS